MTLGQVLLTLLAISVLYFVFIIGFIIGHVKGFNKAHRECNDDLIKHFDL